MQIKDYLNEILKRISENSYIESQNISFQDRPPDAAYISGLITFINGSQLHFKEFIILKSESVDILKYGYNYLSRSGTLVFRYDNAFDPRVKNLSTYPEHKHSSNKLLPAKRPALETLLREISSLIEQDVKK